MFNAIERTKAYHWVGKGRNHLYPSPPHTIITGSLYRLCPPGISELYIGGSGYNVGSKLPELTYIVCPYHIVPVFFG